MNNTIKLGLERDLNFRADAKIFSGTLKIDRIELTSTGRWSCHWSCEYLCDDGHVFGDDPLDALVCCLRLISGLIVDAPKTGLTVWWKEIGDNGRLHTGWC